jgi:hypothetical protein
MKIQDALNLLEKTKTPAQEVAFATLKAELENLVYVLDGLTDRELNKYLGLDLPSECKKLAFFVQELYCFQNEKP